VECCKPIHESEAANPGVAKTNTIATLLLLETTKLFPEKPHSQVIGTGMPTAQVRSG
jgi:hypothetical protein